MSSPIVDGLRILPTQHSVPQNLRARHGFPAELMRNISALGALAAAAAAPDP
ncbi:MAG: hypothetical protein ACYDBZ_11915 [Steroidobacteraceae bacterium]